MSGRLSEEALANFRWWAEQGTIRDVGVEEARELLGHVDALAAENEGLKAEQQELLAAHERDLAENVALADERDSARSISQGLKAERNKAVTNLRYARVANKVLRESRDALQARLAAAEAEIAAELDSYAKGSTIKSEWQEGFHEGLELALARIVGGAG